ncbi:TetR/AcrR family transcriptional regulator [Paenibacillus sp. MWE-103]|uniref:TetR/AcrR family transcriptional regulator n=1 Tax=Paenibacillus artemisiicola TaxID=1172618 RepID=A0ABS3W461_9BACL|nr:TetR/AcrR family transcriptional regulator [Paenibacillus artemisiicola]
MTKVDRRIIKTREAINKALIELMSEKSFENITINDIAEKANLNRGTLYLHYTDKYDLLDKCIKDHLGNLPIPQIQTKNHRLSRFAMVFSCAITKLWRRRRPQSWLPLYKTPGRRPERPPTPPLPRGVRSA